MVFQILTVAATPIFQLISMNIIKDTSVLSVMHVGGQFEDIEMSKIYRIHLLKNMNLFHTQSVIM